MISIEVKTPTDLSCDIAQRVKLRRKELGYTQQQLAVKAGMTYASYKRFEQTGLISLQSLAAIAIALGYESDMDMLFSRQAFRSIEDVIAASESKQKAKRRS